MTSDVSAPQRDCGLCPRLVQYREESRDQYPDWHNAPVPAFGSIDASLLIVGLAPGLKGANRTGRPFTGDYAGDLLYETLLKFNFAQGEYGKTADDGLTLVDCRITNGIRCVPPQNKPTGAEIKACRPFLTDEIAAMKNLRCIVSLGAVSHTTVLSALEQKKSAFPFSHCAIHHLPRQPILIDSYHCSRYNTNTRRLTMDMFSNVFKTVREILDNE
jgi:uracil-DNA glycosylase family 4